jgi:hypothetical protein
MTTPKKRAPKKDQPKPPPTLPGERWRGMVDLTQGYSEQASALVLCAIALPEVETERWTYLEFSPTCPTIAQWYEGEWITVAPPNVGAVMAAYLRESLSLHDVRASRRKFVTDRVEEQRGWEHVGYTIDLYGDWYLDNGEDDATDGRSRVVTKHCIFTREEADKRLAHERSEADGSPEGIRLMAVYRKGKDYDHEPLRRRDRSGEGQACSERSTRVPLRQQTEPAHDTLRRCGAAPERPDPLARQGPRRERGWTPGGLVSRPVKEGAGWIALNEALDGLIAVASAERYMLTLQYDASVPDAVRAACIVRTAMLTIRPSDRVCIVPISALPSSGAGASSRAVLSARARGRKFRAPRMPIAQVASVRRWRRASSS